MKVSILWLGLILCVLSAGAVYGLDDPQGVPWGEWRFTSDFDASDEIVADKSSDSDALLRRNPTASSISLVGDTVIFSQTGPDDYLRIDIDDLVENGNGSYTNEYTMIFDLKATNADWLPIYNTGYDNYNAADFWLAADGSLGSGSYSDPGVVPLDTWVRLVVVRRLEGSSWVRDVYVDGVKVLDNLGAEGVDGNSSLYTNAQQGEGQFTILSDSDATAYAGCELDNFAYVSVALTDEEVDSLGAYNTQGIFGTMGSASAPYPANEAIDVLRDIEPSWTPSETAQTHDVYFGTNWDDVNDADRSNPRGVLLSQDQTVTTFDPGRLEFGQTYYWRIDEVNSAPDYTIFKGDVWSFTVELFAYAIENVTATSNTTSTVGQGPERLVDGSGLNDLDQHSTDTRDMWVGTPNPDEPSYVQFEFDGVYKLFELILWNYNMEFETLLGFGVKDATISYSLDGSDWTILGDFELAQAPGIAVYTADTIIPFEGAAAQYVRLTIGRSWSPTATTYGLSEVRFMYIPVQAGGPQPVDGATGVALIPSLSWHPGREADVHEIYLGTDPEALTLIGTTSKASFSPAALDLDTVYYWQVVEVNDAEAVMSWASDIWSFTTQDYIEVDGFESYTDDIEAGETIWQTWIDGIDDASNGGGVVGNTQSPFAEQTIVLTGGQSMNFFYKNDNSTAISEADRTFAEPQDWTASGVGRLALWFHGAEGNTGQLYIKINGVKVAYEGEAGDMAETLWQPWFIDLTTLGVDRTNVTVLSVGVQGTGSGVVYIDDIRLYP